MGVIEIIAVIFGVLCVALVVKQSIWCWPAGLIQVSLYCYIFFEVKLYSDLILHIIYIFLNIYGWYHWLHGGKKDSELTVTTLTNKDRLFWIMVCCIGTVAWGFGMNTYTDAALPYPDAFTTVTSLTAQWLMAQKKLENWVLWIIVDIAAIAIYYEKSLDLTSGLYFVFLLLSAIGLQQWFHSMKPETKTTLEGEELTPTLSSAQPASAQPSSSQSSSSTQESMG